MQVYGTGKLTQAESKYSHSNNSLGPVTPSSAQKGGLFTVPVSLLRAPMHRHTPIQSGMRNKGGAFSKRRSSKQALILKAQG